MSDIATRPVPTRSTRQRSDIAELHRQLEGINADMADKRIELRKLTSQYTATRLAILDAEAAQAWS